jgi:TRAP-type C4-dicarboxylate transport system permease small subunit
MEREKNIESGFNRINDILHSLGIIILAFVIFYIFLDIMARVLHFPPIGDVVELTGYLNVWLTFLGVGFVLHEGKHISVDFVTSLVSPNIKRILKRVSDVISILFCAVMTYCGVRLVQHSYVVGQRLLSWDFPVWIFQIVIPLGFLMLMLESLFDFVKQRS